jgi:hypothetical protein
MKDEALYSIVRPYAKEIYTTFQNNVHAQDCFEKHEPKMTLCLSIVSFCLLHHILQ